MSNKKRVPWNKGRKETEKHVYYTNGVKNIRVKETDMPPEGFYRGRVVHWTENSKKSRLEKSKKTCLERYNDENYNNITKTKQTKLNRYGNENYNNREKSRQTCINTYGVDNPFKRKDFIEQNKSRLIGHKLSEETKQKISNKKLGSHLSDESRIQKILSTDKTYRERGLYEKHITKPELFVKNLLEESFGKEHIFYNYIDKDRYPFKCDFYIDTYDLFIEVHAGWRHCGRPFDENDSQCIEYLEELKLKNTNNYKNVIYTWTDLDVRKLKTAKENNLNFVRLYPNDIYFINEKPRELLENLVELYHPQDNQQPRLPIWK